MLGFSSMAYQPESIEKKWQNYWAKNAVYKTGTDPKKPKYYVLDMFPYPSGAGLHVGHPLGYIASDIICRFRRAQGFNVLHPMGWDAFGLPAEQYAIQTGQHPATTTKKNIATYREQLDKIGLSFDWSREVSTCDPEYYKWTQWAFAQMFDHYYDVKLDKAMPISHLEKQHPEWTKLSPAAREAELQNHRIAYLADLPVNWCAALGTVLANDEVKDGLSVRGGHPVEQRIMKQWSLRISPYAERLLQGLEKLEWSEAVKEMQRNWIGKSVGGEVDFAIQNSTDSLRIFTTRPDTIFGVSFMVLAPESDWSLKLASSAQRPAVDAYLEECKKRTERDRLADVKRVSGVFTGSYAIHPFTKKPIPIWIGDYVLGGYGTGAIMAVPAHDSRDYAFAKHFSLPILPVVEGGNIEKEAFEATDGKMINSDFMNGLQASSAITRAIQELEKLGVGTRKVNYRLRDAIFSRQRYWGEPFPVYYKDGLPKVLPTEELPVALPEVDKYLPTETGEPPLGRAKNWQTKDGYPLELSTMPGFAGSSAYYFRYMDPKNSKELASKESLNYWQNVDLYIGGAEHATGHLIYSRFWCKFLFDIGFAPVEEPFKKLVNQGLIQGRSSYVYRLKSDVNTFVSYGLRDKYDTQALHVDVSFVENDFLNLEAFRNWRPEYKNAKFILEDDRYRCGSAAEKMSKSFYNVINPDQVVARYGADTLRLFEMFLGPLEQFKPWNMSGIEGVYRFLQKAWRWTHGNDESETLSLSTTPVSEEAMRVLHQTIDKVTKDIQNLSFNTAVSQFMICVNELSGKAQTKEVFETFAVLLAPFAPHFAEELWAKLGHTTSVTLAPWPAANPQFLVANAMKIVVQVNGKLRDQFEAPVGSSEAEVFAIAMAREAVQAQLAGKTIRKQIYVNGKLVNFVV